MTTRPVETRFLTDPRSAAWRAIGASGSWLRVGFVGASMFAIGLVMLFSGQANPGTALLSVGGGGLVAFYAWRHSWALLNQADVEDAARRETAGLAAFGSSIG